MKIYLDPHTEGCVVWFDNGNVQSLYGYPIDICKRIKNFAIDIKYDSKSKPIERQVVKVYLDDMGIGITYASLLREMGIFFEKCTHKQIM